MPITIPEFSLVVLVGLSGAGKSAFARKHFAPLDVISSDQCRGLVSGDTHDRAANDAAFDLLHGIVEKRLAAAKFTVVDATNLQVEGRHALLSLARHYHCPRVAIIFNLPMSVCKKRSRWPDGLLDPDGVYAEDTPIIPTPPGETTLRREGFHAVTMLNTTAEVEGATVEIQPMPSNRLSEHGPFDLIGDVHGCFDELLELLGQLGYEITWNAEAERYATRHPAGRKVILLGDMVDRGPRIPDVLRLAMDMHDAGTAICVLGNHDNKLLRALLGRPVQIAHGLGESLAQLSAETPAFRERVMAFISGLSSHYVLDDGKLVAAHAGMKPHYQGRQSHAVEAFALFGAPTGESDEFGLPVRINWAADYTGQSMVVYGHTSIAEALWQNNTIDVDTGCVFGGKLTALRYPEKELVSVPARQVYYVTH